MKLYRKASDTNRALLYATLINFLIILCWIVVFKVNRSWVPEMKEYFTSRPFSARIGNNLIPGYSMFNVFKNKEFSFTSDHTLNVLAFIPFGILLPYFYTKNKYLYSALTFIGATLFFEVFQLITAIGYFDSSDLLTNTLGGAIGLLLYLLVFSKLKGNAVNVISTIVNVIATPFSLYAIYNTLLHIDYYI
ncbi:MAG: VanZ family protein [Clostridia bacterium]|nr:VanZ family protein [Clostridia bacterium]